MSTNLEKLTSRLDSLKKDVARLEQDKLQAKVAFDAAQVLLMTHTRPRRPVD